MTTATAIEQFFNKLVDCGELYSGIIADSQGKTIVECFGTGSTTQNYTSSHGAGPNSGDHGVNTSVGGGHTSVDADANNRYSNGGANSKGISGNDESDAGNIGGGPSEQEEEIAADLYATNAVVCASKTIRLLQQLQLGAPPYIAAQYRHHICIHFCEGPCVVTLVGLKSMGHCIGSLTSLISAIKGASIFQETISAVTPELDKYM